MNDNIPGGDRLQKNSDDTDMKNNILVTGASGLIGSHLVKDLIEKNNNVRALYHSSVPKIESPGKLEWVQCDILDVLSLEEAMAGVQKVYHCAAIVSFSSKHKELLHRTNIEGTINVVNACLNKNVEKLLHVSSVSALGRIEKVPITEKMQWTEETNKSEYGKTKFLAEMEIWRGIGEGLNAVIVNPTIVLGAADWNKSSTAIFKNVYREFPWYTEGVTGFVDVRDVVKAMITLMESDIKAERFIISAENITYKELFTMIAKSFGKKMPHKKVTTFIAELIWRVEAVRSALNGKQPLITKETAKTARAKVFFDNSKLFQFLPHFKYMPLQESINRICNEFKKMYNLV